MSGDPTPLRDRLAAAVERFRGARIAVVGDLVADQFVYGEIARVSREAPVLILRYESTETVPGGAGNAAANAAALGARVALVGLVGRDRAGRLSLLELRRRGVDTAGVLSAPGIETPTKTRILAGLAHSLRQQVIRVDREPAAVEAGDLPERLLERARDAVARADVVVVSDYNYGVAGPRMIEAVRAAAAERRVPVVVDSRFRLSEFAGFTSATPNEAELEQLAGAPLAAEADVVEAGSRLARSLDLEALLVTRGSNGMVLVERNREPLRIPIVGAKEAIDVTGAGDTVIAAYALGIASGATFEEAAHLANHAGGSVVMKRGTATVSRDELLASIERT